MCGIAGLIGRNSPKTAKALLDKINHRGPDALAMDCPSESPITLCHSRLSILDTTTLGSQPFHSSDGRFTIVFNGKFTIF